MTYVKLTVACVLFAGLAACGQMEADARGDARGPAIGLSGDVHNNNNCIGRQFPACDGAGEGQ